MHNIYDQKFVIIKKFFLSHFFEKFLCFDFNFFNPKKHRNLLKKNLKKYDE